MQNKNTLKPNQKQPPKTELIPFPTWIGPQYLTLLHMIRGEKAKREAPKLLYQVLEGQYISEAPEYNISGCYCQELQSLEAVKFDQTC